MEKRHVIRLCSLFVIPYVSLFLMYVSFLSESSDLLNLGYGQWIFWMTNVLSIIYGVLIALWLVLIQNLPKYLKRTICILQIICFVFFIAMLYTTLFRGQMYVFLLEGRNFLFEWLGIFVICFLLSYKKETIINETL